MDNNWEQLLNKTWNSEKKISIKTNKTVIINQILDPRPDLSRDSILWQQLLTAANDIDYRLFGALLCMRRAGTGIVRNPNGGLRLYPHIAKNPAIETDRWASLDEYDRLKGEILAPVAEELFKLMGKIVA